METSQLTPVLISAINEWNEMEAPKANYLQLRELEDLLMKGIDLNDLSDSGLSKALAHTLYFWADFIELDTSYQQMRELEEELKDQILAREKQIQSSQELRHAS